ncbi:hypothetical protein A7A08_01642 [Methyloligella halotolerans]|uniref:Uncharacterized protein n=1 Tax=Methyloligella halotolerans TaxID=1177755 RepID=A0A1E2RZU0_9HYPH|nr:hypothetical protein [Methyloligella halotolerans]ODA67608.1 hypothetical protein A7A08_01642 [Methyloligella halotolerans]
MLKYVLAAMTVALLAFTGAQAAPQATSLTVTPAVAHGDSAGMLVEVGNKKWKHRNYKRYKHYKHDRYYRDRHYRYDRDRYYRHNYYRRPPPGWNRYSYRPYGWSRRGCLAFGPVWYCP